MASPPSEPAPARPASPLPPSSRRASAVLLALWLALALLVYVVAARALGPAEDAAILYSYSANLAHTGAISFCPGGPPAEGTTDFLWMVLLAGLDELGLDPHLAATLLSAAAHLGTAWILMRLAGGRDRRIFFGAAFGLFLVPAVFAAMLGFAPLFFGFFVLLAALWFVEERPTALAWTTLVACLVRPDGAVFMLPLLAAAVGLAGARRAEYAKRVLACFV